MPEALRFSAGENAMVNGRAWSDEEDETLKQTIRSNGNTLALAATLGRTHLALMARAKRIGIANPPILESADPS